MSYAKIQTIWMQGKMAYDSTLIASLLSDLQNKYFCLGGLGMSPFIMFGVNWANIEQDISIQKLENLIPDVWIVGHSVRFNS